MMNHIFLRVILSSGLALSLVLFPLPYGPVGQSAPLQDETPAPVEDAVETTGETGEIVVPDEETQPSEAEPPPPVETTDSEDITSTDVPDEIVPDAEPVVEQTPEEETVVVETPGIEETPLVEITGEVTPVPEVDEIPVEVTPIPDVTAEPTAEALPTEQPTDLSIETTPAMEPEISETPIPVVEEQPVEADPVEETPANTPSSGMILLNYDTSVDPQEVIDSLARLGFIIDNSLSFTASGALIVNVPEGFESESVELALSVTGVQSAAPVQIATALDLIPNDPQYSSQQNLTIIDAAGGWDYTTGSSSVIIAVIDTGINYTNPDLAGRIIQGYDFVNNDTDAMDDNGHGTHVAGIIAATGNNSYGIAGLDWSAQIMPIKVLNASGYGTELNVANGIIYAVDHGATIINLSLGLDAYSDLVAQAVAYASQRGVTVIASSGNTNSAVTYPAALPQVIAVGAVDNSENRAPYSNYGPELDVVAPGTSILSTEGTGLGVRTGTSMAAPQVSGLASLLKSIYPLTPAQVKTTVESTSKDLGTTGWDEFFGYGLIRVRSAIEWLLARLTGTTQHESEEEPVPTIIYPTFTPTMTPTMTPTVVPG